MQAVFCYLQRSPQQLFQAADQPDCAQVRAFLQEHGFKSAQIVQTHLPTLPEFAEDLRAAAPSCLVFYVEWQNERITAAVVQDVKRLEPHCPVIWIGPAAGRAPVGVDVRLTEDWAVQLLTLLRSGWQQLPRSAAKTAPAPLPFATDRVPETAAAIPLEAQSLFNGYLVFRTGFYPWEALNRSVKHAALPDDRALQAADWQQLRTYLGMNSGLMLRTAEPAAEEPAFCDADGVWRTVRETYDRLTREAEAADGFLSHLCQWGPESLRFDDLLHPIAMKELPYAKREQADHGFVIFTIESTQDLERFLEDAEHFRSTGRLRSLWQVDGFLADGCRWMGPGTCRLQQLPRLHLADDGSILPCGGCSSAVGALSDGHDRILENVRVLEEREQVLRGCADCEVRDTCSKCALLPDFMSAEQFCLLQKNTPWLSRYVSALNALKILGSTTAHLENLPLEELRFSTDASSVFLPAELPGGAALWRVENRAHLLWLRGEPVLYDWYAQKTFRLNAPLALLFEALLRGVDSDVFSAFLADKLSAAPEQAAALTNKGIANFQKSGYLTRMRKVEAR